MFKLLDTMNIVIEASRLRKTAIVSDPQDCVLCHQSGL
jgi:hypothetical protein